jgi:Ca2+-binding RTX toxin-like protein
LFNVSSINGNSGDDTITGSTGDDELRGGSNDDVLVGGERELDQILATNPSAPIAIPFFGTSGIVLTSMGRTISDDGSPYTIWRIRNGTGSSVNVTLQADNGPVIYSGSVSANSDTFIASGVTAGSATHILTWTEGSSIKAAGTQAFQYDALISGNDTLVGGSGNDFLDGQSGNDSLRGSRGADTLIGGLGSDSIDADGVGIDTIRYNSSSEGVDTILNFNSRTDRFEFLNTGFDSSLGLLGQLASGDPRFITGAVPSTSDLSYRFRFNSNTLYFDPDGTGTQAEVTIATGINSMVATNIWVI